MKLEQLNILALLKLRWSTWNFARGVLNLKTPLLEHKHLIDCIFNRGVAYSVSYNYFTRDVKEYKNISIPELLQKGEITRLRLKEQNGG